MIWLAGDSHAVRFYNFLRKKPNEQLGLDCKLLCAKGGIDIPVFKGMIKQSETCVGEHAVLFVSIGTNDILSGKLTENSFSQFRSILALLQRKYNPSKIFILKIPLFPRLKNDFIKVNQIHKLNIFMSSCSTERVQTLSVPFVTGPNTGNLPLVVGDRKYFQRYYFDGRIDLIHLNDLGYSAVLSFVLSHL